MKTMSKKLASIVLALCLCFSLCCTAFAASGNSGSVTITNALQDEQYAVYQIFDATYDDNTGSVSYTVVSGWEDLLNEYPTYFTITNGYLDPDSGIFNLSDDDDFLVTFAQAALTYAATNEIAATTVISFDANGDATATNGYTATVSEIVSDSSKGITTGTLSVSSLPLGYYLIDTTLGSLCMLTSSTPDAVINEKNTTPTLDKYVEDITEKDEDDYSKEDDADVIDTLQYEIIISNVSNLHNLCLHDVIDDDMILNGGSVTVYLNEPQADNSNKVDEENYTLTIYDENTPNPVEGDKCCFEILFDDDFLATLESTDQLYIIYTVTIDEDVLESENDGGFTGDVHDFQNVAHLSYGYLQTSPEVETDTYTYGFDIYKYTVNNDENVALAGAEFVVKYVDENNVTYYAQFEDEEVDGKLQYVLTDWTTVKEDATRLTTLTDGLIYVEGFDPDTTYYIEETAAPDGYNMLTGDVTVEFVVNDQDATSFTVTYTYGDNTIEATGHQVDILNQSGSELPGTGGMGTTIFYIIGGVLVAGAVVVLITRRRMSTNEG